MIACARSRAFALLAVAIASCSSSPAPKASGSFSAQLGPGLDAPVENGAICATAFAVPTNGPWPLVTDGSSSSEGDGGPSGAVHVACSVHPDGDTFDITATVALGAATRFSVNGKMNTTTSSLLAAFSSGGATFTAQAPCAADFTADPGMGVITGRAWAVVICPVVNDTTGDVCSASAEFVFEGCAP